MCKEVIKELEIIKRGNEKAISAIRKDLNLYNRGYIDALKFQNRLMKLKIKNHKEREEFN